MDEQLSELEKLQQAAQLIEEMSQGRLQVCPSVVGQVYIRPQHDSNLGMDMRIDSIPGQPHYFCRDGSETRVYFPPEPVQEQQLHALAEAPAVHLRDLLTLGLPDHDVYLVHAAEDVGWVPAADLPRLTAQGKEEFSALLDAKIAAIRPGPYGVELVLDGVNSQLLAQYDETLANSSRAEHAMELFL